MFRERARRKVVLRKPSKPPEEEESSSSSRGGSRCGSSSVREAEPLEEQGKAAESGEGQ